MNTVQKLRESTDAILARRLVDLEYASDLGKEIGRHEVRVEVHAWVQRHVDEISIELMRDLFISVGIRKP